jgi:hypothetical protein
MAKGDQVLETRAQLENGVDPVSREFCAHGACFFPTVHLFSSTSMREICHYKRADLATDALDEISDETS